VRTDEIYPYLRDRDTDPDSAKQELDEALERIILSMRQEHPEFYQAYATLPQFREWLQEDVFERTYQDYLTETRDLVTLHADDPDAPEWVRQAGHATVKSHGDTVAIDSSGEDGKTWCGKPGTAGRPSQGNGKATSRKRNGRGPGIIHRRPPFFH
jgi:hypothetical protein